MYWALTLQTARRASRYRRQMGTGADNEVMTTISTYDVIETEN
jgi:hypothetical protein